MGRPPTVPKKFKDGFYIEVCDKGAKSGVKLSCIDKESMKRAIEKYEHSKQIFILGEHKNGKWLTEKIIHKTN